MISVLLVSFQNETSIQYQMKSSIPMYSTDVKSKILIDKLQIVLRCCGSQSLADWFMTDWQKSPGKNETELVFPFFNPSTIS